jgi:hypothetical protein
MHISKQVLSYLRVKGVFILAAKVTTIGVTD